MYNLFRESPVTFKPSQIRLDRIERVIPLSPREKEILNLNFSIYEYPYQGPLIKKIAEKDKIKEDQISLGNGADGCLRKVFQSILKPNDVVLSSELTYAMYKIYTELNNACYEEIKYTNYTISNNTIIENIRKLKPKIVVLANPDQPIGNYYDYLEILTEIKKYNGYLILDKAYDSFQKPFIDNNLIIINSFSKYFGLCGIRLGYLISSNSTIKLIDTYRGSYEVNSMALHFGINIIDNWTDMQWYQKQIIQGSFILRTMLINNNFKLIASNQYFNTFFVDKNFNTIKKNLKNLGWLVKSYDKHSMIRVSSSDEITMNKFILDFKKCL